MGRPNADPRIGEDASDLSSGRLVCVTKHIDGIPEWRLILE
jgi:hypothetical protein